MALLAYDEVMLREPRLLVPKMQPLGAVKVKPEYGGDFAFCALGTGNGPDRMNLRTPEEGSYVTRATGRRMQQNFYATANVWESDNVCQIYGAMPRTYLWVGRILTIPGDAVIFEHGAASGDGAVVQIMVYTNNICMHLYGGGWLTAGIAAASGTEYVVGFTYNGGTTTIKMFIDGRLRETFTSLPGALATGLSTVKSNNTLAYFNSALPVESEMIAILPRCLGDEEMLTLTRDPYTILTPTT